MNLLKKLYATSIRFNFKITQDINDFYTSREKGKVSSEKRDWLHLQTSNKGPNSQTQTRKWSNDSRFDYRHVSISQKSRDTVRCTIGFESVLSFFFFWRFSKTLMEVWLLNLCANRWRSWKIVVLSLKRAKNRVCSIPQYVSIYECRFIDFRLTDFFFERLFYCLKLNCSCNISFRILVTLKMTIHCIRDKILYVNITNYNNKPSKETYYLLVYKM